MAIISSREEDSQLVATVLPYLEFVNGSSQNIILPVEGPTMSSSEKELMEYYATYNVWTGVRTAVVLTMFFLFTVTIILYKSKCKRHSSYELHPSLEDLPGRPLEYYDYWCPTPVGGGGGDNFSHTSKDMFCRIFDDGVVDPLGSAPLPTHMKGDGSFPSIYSSFRIKSLPGSVLRMNFSRMGSLEKEEISRFTVPSCYSTPTRIKKPRLWSVPNASSFLSSNAAPDDCLPSSPDEIVGEQILSSRSDFEFTKHETAPIYRTFDIENSNNNRNSLKKKSLANKGSPTTNCSTNSALKPFLHRNSNRRKSKNKSIKNDSRTSQVDNINCNDALTIDKNFNKFEWPTSEYHPISPRIIVKPKIVVNFCGSDTAVDVAQLHLNGPIAEDYSTKL